VNQSNLKLLQLSQQYTNNLIVLHFFDLQTTTSPLSSITISASSLFKTSLKTKSGFKEYDKIHLDFAV
jgi:hypothetical protein